MFHQKFYHSPKRYILFLVVVVVFIQYNIAFTLFCANPIAFLLRLPSQLIVRYSLFVWDIFCHSSNSVQFANFCSSMRKKKKKNQQRTQTLSPSCIYCIRIWCSVRILILMLMPVDDATEWNDWFLCLSVTPFVGCNCYVSGCLLLSIDEQQVFGMDV